MITLYFYSLQLMIYRSIYQKKFYEIKNLKIIFYNDNSDSKKKKKKIEKNYNCDSDDDDNIYQKKNLKYQ